MRRSRQINVPRALALAGAFNFLVSAAKACLLPFLTLYLRHLGLNPTQAGLVMGAKHLVSLVWSPVSGLLSKYYDKRRVLINGCLVASAFIALAVPFIPPGDTHTLNCFNQTSEETLNPAQSSITPASLKTTLKPTLKTTSPRKISIEVTNGSQEVNNSLSLTSVVNQSSTSIPGSRKKRSNDFNKNSTLEANTDSHFDFLSTLKAMDLQHQLFFLILIAVSALAGALAPLEWTADDGLYEYLDFADASDRYSNSKAWSSVGAAFGVGGAGLLVSRFSCLIAAETSRSVVHFVCFAAIALGTVPVASFLPFYLNRKRSRPDGLVKGLQLVHGSSRALLCAVTVLLVGVVTSTVDNFLLWEMQDNGSNELNMGLSLAVGLLSQASFPLFVRRVAKILSPGSVLSVSAAVLAVQCLFFSFLWGPWAVLPVQVFNSLSFGALWWAVQVQRDDVATPGTERSVGRVYRALCHDLGLALGSVMGGPAVQRFGVGWVFRGASLGLVLWSAVLPLLQVKAPRHRRINYSRLLAADASEASESESEQEKDWLDKAMGNERSNNNYAIRTQR